MVLDKYRSTVEKIIETVHYHTFAVELAAKLLENGISTPGQLLAKKDNMPKYLLFLENITADNARLVSNLRANLGGLYRMNGYPNLAREHIKKSISLLDQFNLLHINDSIPQIANYAMFLILFQMQHILLILMEKAFQHTPGLFQLVSDPFQNPGFAIFEW